MAAVVVAVAVAATAAEHSAPPSSPCSSWAWRRGGDSGARALAAGDEARVRRPLRRRGTRPRRLMLVLALLAALPAGAAETHYVLVPGASIVRFELRCLGLFSITGRFTTVEGTVMLAAGDGQSIAIDLTIPVRSLRLGSAGRRARETQPAGRGEALVSGTLKMHGIERALQLKASAESSPPELKVRAHAEVRRS